MKPNYRITLYACYIGYVSQAITINLLPLLFVVLQKEFSLSLAQIGFMVSYNFVVQIIVDLLGAKYAERVGYRVCAVAGQLCCVVGVAGLAVFPDLMSNAYAGLLICVTVYAIGAGMIEVLVSPMVQALPLERKESVMSLLHSFYCWGYTAVVLLTTLFFSVAGTERWRLVACLWAIVPAVNAVLFSIAPIRVLTGEGDGLSIKAMFKNKVFWLLVLLMICAGACEQAMCQWSSYFAETGLRISKTVGDLLGPCVFAVLMGLSRWFYGVRGDRIPLAKFVTFSGFLCVASYLIAVFSPIPLLSLLGCGLCGLSVGILWPGTLSMSAKHCPQGGTAMFAMLALAGDVGCSSGPFVVSTVTEAVGGELKAGLLAAVMFPVALVLGIRALHARHRG